VIAISFLIMPAVVTSMTPLVTYGTQVTTLAAKYGPELATGEAIDPPTQATLATNPLNGPADAKAVGEIAAAFHISPAAATARFTQLATVPQADLLFLKEHATDVQNAASAASGQWKDWWWVCLGGQVLFIPLILLMTGRWSPRRAREDAEEHERKVQQELSALGS
jgi:hypothetical protein